MAVDETIYIVDFEDAVTTFEKRLTYPELPTIDLGMVKWWVMSIFEFPVPLAQLERVADELVSRDYLFSKEEFFETTPGSAVNTDREMRDYLRESIVTFGRMMCDKFTQLGMYRTGNECYTITSRPMNNETYIFKRTRC
jgi:hypothetical protein